MIDLLHHTLGTRYQVPGTWSTWQIALIAMAMIQGTWYLVNGKLCQH